MRPSVNIEVIVQGANSKLSEKWVIKWEMSHVKLIQLTVTNSYEIKNEIRRYTQVKCLMYRLVWIVCFYFAWITFHYIAAHLYVKYCTPSSIMGFILSPFIASTPHCEGLRWIITSGGSNINAMWVLTGSWVVRELSTAGEWVVR